MLIFLNVFITNNRTHYPRYNLRHDDRLNVFKYSLNSLSYLKFDGGIINVELDSDYRSQYSHINEYINGLFGDNVKINNKRCLYQSEYCKCIDELEEYEGDYIWFCGNDDHIYLDSNNDIINDGLIQLDSIDNEYKSIYYTHWPELIWMAYENNEYKIVNQNNNYFRMTLKGNVDSVQLLSKDTLRAWFFNKNYGNIQLRRSDNFGYDGCSGPSVECLVPRKEIVRHFDGYSHIGLDPNLCPPLHIPNGFFTNNITIDYFGENNVNDYVINPLLKNKAIDINGTDFDLMIEDLPLFLRDKIGGFKNNFTEDKMEIALQQRKENIIKCSQAKSREMPSDDLLFDYPTEEKFKEQLIKNVT